MDETLGSADFVPNGWHKRECEAEIFICLLNPNILNMMLCFRAFYAIPVQIHRAQSSRLFVSANLADFSKS